MKGLIVGIIVKVTEYHQLNRYLRYDLEEDAIIESFGSLEAFQEAVAEESPVVYEFLSEADYDAEDDCWTMNSGGYDTSMEIEAEETITKPKHRYDPDDEFAPDPDDEFAAP